MSLKYSCKFLFWTTVTLLWSLVLLYITLKSSPPMVKGFFGWDKLQHAVALGSLAFLVSRFCLELPFTLLKATVSGFIAATLFGGLIEILQWSCTTTRQADILDLAADAVGAFLAMLIMFLLTANRGNLEKTS